MTEPVYAGVSCRKLNAFGIVRAEAHGRRVELASTNEKVRTRMENRIREDYDPHTPRSIGFAYQQDDHLSVRAAWEQHCRDNNARPWGKSPLCLHMLVHLSSGWVPAKHKHDPDHPKVKEFFNAVRDWAKSAVGGVIAARMDLDERSCLQLDIFCAPVFPPPSNQKSNYIMTNKALALLQEKTGEVRSYSALQTSWAAYCQKNLDPAIRRGERKEKTGRVHVHADVIRTGYEENEARAKALDDRQAEQDARKKALDLQAVQQRGRESELSKLSAQLKDNAKNLESWGKELRAERAKLAEKAELVEREAERVRQQAKNLVAHKARLGDLPERANEMKRLLQWCADRLPDTLGVRLANLSESALGYRLAVPIEENAEVGAGMDLQL